MVLPRQGHQANIATVTYMESIGLDPYRILQEGVSRRGYLEIRRDRHGNTILTNGEPVTRWRQWPPGFVWTILVQCMRYDGIWPGGELI